MNQEKLERLFDSIDIKWEKSHGDWWMTRCPHPDHEDKHPSFGINLIERKANCFSCGRFPLWKALAYLKGVGFSEAKRLLKKPTRHVSRTSILRARISSSTDIKPKIRVKLPLTPLPDFFKVLKRSAGKYYKYLKNRGFSLEFVNSKKIGYCDEGYYEKRIIMPIYFQGKRVGFCARSILNDRIRNLLYNGEKRQKKYLFSKGFKWTNILYNYRNIEEATIITEGVINAYTLENWGYKNVVSTFSSNMHEKQALLLLKKGVKEIILGYDSDKAGEKGINRVYNLFEGEIIISKLEFPPKKDINDLSKREFSKILEKRVEISGKNLRKMISKKG